MNVVNGMEGVNSVKGMEVMGMIEKERVSEKEDLNSDVSGTENKERKMKKSLAQLEEMPMSSAPKVTLAAVENLTIKVEASTKEDTAEIRDSEPEAKIDLNAELEWAAIERLAENERLAEKERQEKIRRREELDRIARLKRILALVRAPELDSVAKMSQVEVERVKMTHGEEMTVLKESDVVTEINPVLKIRKTEEVKELTKLKPLVEQKAVVEADMLVKKKRITEYEGIVKLERMSKSERISEIDRLVNLELEAEAKRRAKFERLAELECSAEVERVAKMKRLTEIDLKAEMENAEKERMAEEKRQEKIQRKEELERVARLQRVLANILAFETNQAVEAQAARLERVKEKTRKDEIKLLEELGIIPTEQITKTESGKQGKSMEGEKLVATVATGEDTIPVNVTEMKDETVNPVNGFKQMTEVTQLLEVKERFTDVDIDKLASMEQPSDMESDTMLIDMVAEAEREAKNKHVALIEDKTKASQDTKRKYSKELESVSNLQRNTELKRVAEMKQMADFEKAAELKRREEINLLEELGIISTAQVAQTQGGEVNPVEVNQVAVLDEDAKSMEGIKDQNSETQLDTVAEVEREVNIKCVAEMERKAKADREAKIKRREELVRVANLQRVVAMVDNEEFDHVPKIKNEELERMAEKKRREDMKVLKDLGLVSKEQEIQQSVANAKAVDKNNDSPEIKPVKDAHIKVGLKAPTELTQRELNVKLESSPERVIDMEQMSANERSVVKRDVERRLTELRVEQMKLVAEMGREMKNATIKQEDQREINHMTETERTKEATVLKRREEFKPLEKSRLSNVRQDLGVQSKMNGVEKSKTIDSVLPEKREGVESIIEVERKELKPAEPRRIYEVKRATGLESVELKRLKEMKRVVGMERVSGRDCEWDVQMMYVGKA